VILTQTNDIEQLLASIALIDISKHIINDLPSDGYSNFINAVKIA